MRRTWWAWLLTVMCVVGCGSDAKTSGTTGSAGPSLDAQNPEERAAAAREAAKKYGAEP